MMRPHSSPLEGAPSGDHPGSPEKLSAQTQACGDSLPVVRVYRASVTSSSGQSTEKVS